MEQSETVQTQTVISENGGEDAAAGVLVTPAEVSNAEAYAAAIKADGATAEQPKEAAKPVAKAEVIKAEVKTAEKEHEPEDCEQPKTEPQTACPECAKKPAVRVCEVCGHVNKSDSWICEMCSNYLID